MKSFKQIAATCPNEGAMHLTRTSDGRALMTPFVVGLDGQSCQAVRGPWNERQNGTPQRLPVTAKQQPKPRTSFIRLPHNPNTYTVTQNKPQTKTHNPVSGMATTSTSSTRRCALQVWGVRADVPALSDSILERMMTEHLQKWVVTELHRCVQCDMPTDLSFRRSCGNATPQQTLSPSSDVLARAVAARSA